MLTISPGRLQRGRVPDGPSPPLRLPQVGERVLDERHPKALLHPLAGHPRAHPAPLERVEVGGEVGAHVGAVRPSVRPAAHAVRQAEHCLGPAGRRGDPLDGERALRQAHRVAEPVVERVGELPVQRAHQPVPLAGRSRFRGAFLHPWTGRVVDASRRPVVRMAVRCELERLSSSKPCSGRGTPLGVCV